MALRLEITSNHKDILGDDQVRVFRQDGGTIGRSLQNDWILPDKDKYISGKHATVDCRAGAFYLADVSTNGVYVNGADEPLGKGNPRRLFDGDMLRMGDFEMLVHLDEGEDLQVPEEAQAVASDYIDQQASDEHIRSSIMLLDEEELTGDEEFQAALFGAAAPADAEAPLLDESDRIRFDLDEDDAAMFEASLNEGASSDLLTVFLTALGIKRADIHPSIDPAEVMTNAGLILRELVRGTTDLLVSRANVKSMFRLDQTTVMPRHNNPLKLTADTSESIKQLLVGQDGEYLGPLDSVQEVCRDLKFHHDAVLGGMTKAFGEFIDRFDPDELQDSFDKTLDRKPLFEALNQVKYWNLYCDLYPIITQRGNGTLPQQFSEEFVREYERSIAEFKRLERGLQDTQKLEPGAIPAAAQPSNDPLGPDDDDLDFEITEVLEEVPDTEAQA
jgi:type VI secretion system protein ImpI